MYAVHASLGPRAGVQHAIMAPRLALRLGRVILSEPKETGSSSVAQILPKLSITPSSRRTSHDNLVDGGAISTGISLIMYWETGASFFLSDLDPSKGSCW